ncbi:HD domain-containing protein [bacterium]|nr:HD domain-containing protein [bacterium]
MRACSIDSLNPGMVLGQPLYTYVGGRRTLLLGRSAELSVNMIDKLRSMKYTSVYIEEKGTEHITPVDVLADATRDSSLQKISQYYDNVYSSMNDYVRSAKGIDELLKRDSMMIALPPSARLRESVKEIFQDLFLIGNVPNFQIASGVSRANALHNHVLNVAVLVMLLGDVFDFTDQEQAAMGMGALLHDIGKTALGEIYDKSHHELDPEQRSLMRHHPVFGEKILSRARTISEIERQIVLQHHERQNGSGYPSGLVGDNSKPMRSAYTKPRHIFRFAELISVANVYENLISGSLVQQMFSPKEALQEMLAVAGSQLNSSIVEGLFNIITLYPVAQNVEIVRHPNPLLTGARCVVEKSESNDFSELLVVILTDNNGQIHSPRSEVLNLGEDVEIQLLAT